MGGKEMSTCPVCDTQLIKQSGSTDSEILIIGNYPTDKEIERLKPQDRHDLEPFIGWGGKYFRQELAKAGLDYYQCRAITLWKHKQNKEDECLNYMIAQVILEAKDKKLILLCGAEVVSTFLDYKVSDTCGLWMDCTYFSGKVMPMYNPSQMLHGGLGEIRLCLKKFCLEVEKL
jgi:uracil-DNA glycosylase